MKLKGPEERLAEESGVSLLLIGPTGVGKTSEAATIKPPPLVIDIEAGILPIRHLPIASLPIRTFREFMDIVCAVGGPDPALPASSAYSAAHYEQVSAKPELMGLAEFDTYFVDSFTALSRLSFIHCEQLPESFSDRGKRDVRAIYGAHARNLLAAANHLQHARGKTIIFVAILERTTDDTNTPVWGVQLEGSKTARELPGIVDQVVTMDWINFGDGKPIRTFVCTSPNPWNYPAKDRSGRLDQFEPPDLGKLIAKLTSSPSST